jgi:hypothetical protein
VSEIVRVVVVGALLGCATLFVLAALFVVPTLLVVPPPFLAPALTDVRAEVPNPKLTVAASTAARTTRVQRSHCAGAGIAARSFWKFRIVSLQPEKEAAGKIARRGLLFRRPGSLRESRGFASLSRERFALSIAVEKCSSLSLHLSMRIGQLTVPATALQLNAMTAFMTTTTTSV